MRYTNIKNSIANAICRFSARVNAMLSAFDIPQRQWHLQPCVGPISGRHFGAESLLRNLDMSSTGTDLSGYLPEPYQPVTCEITGSVVLKRLFQRLS